MRTAHPDLLDDDPEETAGPDDPALQGARCRCPCCGAWDPARRELTCGCPPCPGTADAEDMLCELCRLWKARKLGGRHHRDGYELPFGGAAPDETGQAERTFWVMPDDGQNPKYPDSPASENPARWNA